MKSVLAIAGLMLSGCATTSTFTQGMTQPTEELARAATLPQLAERDVMRGVASGLIKQSDLPPAFDDVAFLVCAPIGSGLAQARSDLEAFPMALQLVQKVGEKPSDTTYSGYIKAFRRNLGAGKGREEFASVPTVNVKPEDDKIDRCIKLFAADVDERTRVAVLTGFGAPAVLAAANLFLKTLLSQIETLSRELAVRQTINELLPHLQRAALSLKERPGTYFGPVVQYQTGSAPEAEAINSTAIGAALTIRRWAVAMQAISQWQYLSECRALADRKCPGDPRNQAASIAFTSSAFEYRALASVEPSRILESVDSAITVTKNSLESPDIASLIDGLLEVADSFAALDTSYSQFKSSFE